MSHPTIQVGIMSASEIDFSFQGVYRCGQLSGMVTGRQRVVYQDGVLFDPALGKRFSEICFYPESKDNYFELQRVIIGIDFHWERAETQRFRGALRMIPDQGRLTVINIVDVEEYLQSVISSEMSATASLEYLKVHAVISRSWLLAQIARRDRQEGAEPANCIRTGTEWIQWFDREDHHLFDVCADDHCQRYQGITRIVLPTVKQAVDTTRGMILAYDGEICDTRFYKCCGGVTESFENTWEPHHHPYLVKVTDRGRPHETDLTDEVQAYLWITGSPPAYCNTLDNAILGQVLNNYDQETQNFYRWKVSYTQEELSVLILNRSGIDFGQITGLIPLQRGVSGRIIRLRIEGTKCTMVVGKELLIRRLLSASHLYSSAFVVEKQAGKNGIPQSFTLYGAGWGHGVGLCQIGAAVMCTQGQAYTEVLMHYYPGSSIEIWETLNSRDVAYCNG